MSTPGTRLRYVDPRMVYTFLTFDLDEERLELRDAGSPVAAEPRVLDFLIYLVRHRDRVVTKDELATEVWGARVVSDASLARCASDARRLLGDVERPYRVIETVYGRGYRFAATVTEHDARSAVEDTAETPRSPPASRPWLRAAMAAGLLLAVGTAFMVGWAPDRTTTESPPKVAIAWSASQEDSELRWVGLSLADLVGHTLSEDPRLTLAGLPFFLNDTSVTALSSRGRTMGGSQLLHLAVEPTAIAGHAELRARWFDDLTQPRPAAIPLLRDVLPVPGEGQKTLDRYLQTRKTLVRTLEQRLRLTLDDAPRKDSPMVPRDAEAWRLYLSAAVNWKVACSDREHEALLRRSVELDPRFAPAWYLLGGTQLARSNLCGTDGASYELARHAVGRALELAPEWPEPRQLLAALELYRNATEEAYVRLAEARQRFPNNFNVLLRYAEVLRYAGFLEGALEVYEEAVSLWPAGMALTDTVSYPFLYLGEWERFLKSVSGRDSPYFRYYRGWAEWQSGRQEVARSILEPAFREHPGDLFARLAQALLAIINGSYDEASVVLEQLGRQQEATRAKDGEVTYKIAQLLVLAQESDLGLEQLDLAVSQGFFCPGCMVRDPAFATVRTDERFLASFDRARERHRAFAERFELLPELGDDS